MAISVRMKDRFTNGGFGGATVSDCDQLQALIGEIYDLALEPAQWSSTLGNLVNVFGGNGVAISDKDFRENQPTFILQSGFCNEIVKLYTEHYIKTDIRFAAAQHLPAGSLLHEPMFITEAEMDRSEYYQEFLAPFDFRYHLGGALENSNDVIAAIAIQRSPRAGAFEDVDIKRLTLLLPHLRRALLIQRRLDTLQRRGQMLVEILDRLPTGVVVLDEQAKPVIMNRTAEALVASGDGLRSTPDGLAACRPQETAALLKLVAQALVAGLNQSFAAAESILLARPSRNRPLVVSVVPGGSTLSGELALSGRHAILFVSDPETRPRVRLSPAFIKSYAFTPTEARLLEALVNGATPENAQALFGISMATVRKHLQTIFCKAGVNRQIDLVRLVLTSPLQFTGTE